MNRLLSPVLRTNSLTCSSRNAGTVFTFCPLTPAAKEWVSENVHTESYQWLGATFCVEHRYAWALAEGMIDVGLVLQ
jgi:hypothetical protein